MTQTKISEFREAVYQEVIWRPAAILDLVDALTIAGHVNSPVVLSESPVFRRKFSSVDDALGDELKTLFNRSQDPDWETMAGYEVHAIDATPNEWMVAETLADRGALKAQQKEALRYGHKYSWLVRLVQRGATQEVPEDMERIGTGTTDTKVAAQQIKGLAVRNPRPKVITADSRYRDRHFLGAFADLQSTYALVRLQNNQKLSQEPVPKPKGSRGAPRKHGADFQLTDISRPPDASEEFFLGKQNVQVRVWHKLHFKRLAKVVGAVVCVEFLKEDDAPRYNRYFCCTPVHRLPTPDPQEKVPADKQAFAPLLENALKSSSRPISCKTSPKPAEFVSASRLVWFDALQRFRGVALAISKLK